MFLIKILLEWLQVFMQSPVDKYERMSVLSLPLAWQLCWWTPAFYAINLPFTQKQLRETLSSFLWRYRQKNDMCCRSIEVSL